MCIQRMCYFCSRIYQMLRLSIKQRIQSYSRFHLYPLHIMVELNSMSICTIHQVEICRKLHCMLQPVCSLRRLCMVNKFPYFYHTLLDVVPCITARNLISAGCSFCPLQDHNLHINLYLHCIWHGACYKWPHSKRQYCILVGLMSKFHKF